MASPVANGLFAKAIGQSGSLFPGPNRIILSREQAEDANVAWASRVFGTARLFYLRSLTVDDLVKAAMARTNPPPPHFSPIIDGYFLPDSLPNIYADGNQAHVPLLAGWVANEALPPSVPTADDFKVQAHIEFGPDALKFLNLFPATTDAEAAQSANDLASDRSRGYISWSWVEAQTRNGKAPVYCYFFDLASPGDRIHSVAMGAYHMDDIEYVFGTLDSRPGMAIRPEDRALSELMQQYWTNFAKSKTGDPNGPGLPKWPVYNRADDYTVMHLDATPEAKPDERRPRYMLLDSVWGSAAAPTP
jgi:para-nitrobenzyl esterase